MRTPSYTFASTPRQFAAGRVVRLIGTLVCAALLVSCGGGGRGGQRLFEAIPASSVVAMSIDWRAVRDDAALKRLIESADVERLFGELGVDSSDVDEIVIFGDGRGARSGSAGLILRGAYDVDNILKHLRVTGWREQAQEGATLYVKPNGDEYFAALGDWLVVGTQVGVTGVLASDDGESLATRPAYEKLGSYLDASNAPVRVVLVAPQRVQDMAEAGLHASSMLLDVAGLGALSGIVEQLGAVRGVGCAITHAGDVFPVELVAVMRDVEAASLVSGMLSLTQTFALAVPSDADPSGRHGALDNLQNLTVTRDEEVLFIKAVLTDAQLQLR